MIKLKVEKIQGIDFYFQDMGAKEIMVNALDLLSFNVYQLPMTKKDKDKN